MAVYGYVGLFKAMESNVYYILSNGEPLYYAYTTYLLHNVVFSLEIDDR